MPRRFQNVLQNFKAGVLSPRMAARVDFEAYNNSLKTGKNFIVTPQGSASFRRGTSFVGYPPGNQPFRVFQYRNGGDRPDAIVEVSPGIIRYWVQDPETGDPILFSNDSTLLVDEVGGDFLIDEDDLPEEVNLTVGVSADANPYSVADLEDLYFTNQDKFAVICHPRHPPMFITSQGDGSLVAAPLEKIRIPEFRYNDLKNPAIAAGTADWQITAPENWSTTYLPIYRVSYNNITGAAAAGERLLTFQWSATAATNATNIQAGLDAAAARAGYLGVTFVVASVSSEVYTVNVTGTDAGWTPKIIEVTGALSGDALLSTNPVTAPFLDGDPIAEQAWSYPEMVYQPLDGHYYQCIAVHTSVAATAPDQAGDENVWGQYWVDLGTGEPDGFNYEYPNGNDWAGDTTPATVYSPKDRGFPTVCIFNDQRLVLMANKDNPTALYGSGIAEFLNFITGPEDNDPFIFVLDSTDTPVIKWARSQFQLTVGTSAGEWIIDGTPTITPTSVKAIQQNFARSHLAIPIQVDDEIFYIEMGGRKIRSTRYTDEWKAMNSSDISVLAEDMIAEDRVSRIIGTYIPETFIQILRNTGQIVFMTYDKTMGVMAYSEMETDGDVYDMCGYFSLFAQEDTAIYAINRNGNYVLESMRYPDGKFHVKQTENGAIHMDSFVAGDVDGQIITGLGHLNGKNVSLLINDAWIIGTHTVANNQLVLPKSYTGKYVVGLPFTGTLETFEPNQAPGQTALGTKRRWNMLTTRLLNSALPKVYSQLGEDRTPATVMDTPETVREGLQDVRQNVTGYTDGSIVVVQDRPYQTQVLGFFGEYQTEDR